MLNTNKDDNVVYPSKCLAEESRFNAFICQEYPKSCNQCLEGWNSICNVCKKDKEKSMKNNDTRPSSCPLIQPSYIYDNTGLKYPRLPEIEWIKRNPIIMTGSVVVSGEGTVKVGDGNSNYCSLPDITTSKYLSNTNDPNKRTTIDIDKIKKPQDIIDAFNVLQARAIEIGYPIKVFKYEQPSHPLLKMDAILTLIYDKKYPNSILAGININDTLTNLMSKD